MPKRRKRASVSIRISVHDRLMYHVSQGHPDRKLTGSNVTEEALARLLDEAGVPETVPPHKPAKTRPPGGSAPDGAAYFTF